MKITHKKVASIHYTLKNKHNQIIDDSTGQPPLTYIHGMGNLIPGMERGLEDKAAGDKLSLIILPQDAYGLRDEKLVSVIPLDSFPEQDKVTPGAQFIARSERGERMATIVSVQGNNVTADFNHPLAGVELHFEVEIMDVREATAEELAHGHVHGEGCSH